VREATAEAGVRASGFGARRRLAFLQVLDQLRKSRDPISRAGRAMGALRERVEAGEAQLGRHGGHVTQGERDHSAVLAAAAQDGLDGEAAKRPSLPNSYPGSLTGMARRADDRDRRSEVAQLSKPSSSA
jgi:hypothetical protein